MSLSVFEGYYNYLRRNKDKINVTPFNVQNSVTEQSPTGLLNSGTVIAEQLIQLNGSKVKEMIDNGIEDEKELLNTLGSWESILKTDDAPIFTFLGLRITTYCNLVGKYRCEYCDQKIYADNLNIDSVIEVAKKITNNGKIRGIRCVISGGEPFVRGIDELFGEKGLVSQLYKLGFIVSMNSNLQLLSPLDVLPIINSGLANIHVSLDSVDKDVNDAMSFSGARDRIMTSLQMIEKVKTILNCQYPLIHINVVGTKHNILYFDKLFKKLLSLRADYNNYKEGNPIVNPDLTALSPHIIVVGGEANKEIRPSVEEWTIFVEKVLPNCRKSWSNFLRRNHIKETHSNSFDIVHSSSNPFFSSIFESNINYSEKIKELVEEEKRDTISNASRCYVAATQGYICPNGDVYSCGAHADRPNAPVLGNIYKNNLIEIIFQNMKYINNELPHSEYCKRCIRSIKSTNAVIEERLKIYIKRQIKNKLSST